MVAVSLNRKSTRLNSSHGSISYAVFCLKKKNKHFNSLHDRVPAGAISLFNIMEPPVTCVAILHMVPPPPDSYHDPSPRLLRANPKVPRQSPSHGSNSDGVYC